MLASGGGCFAAILSFYKFVRLGKMFVGAAPMAAECLLQSFQD